MGKKKGAGKKQQPQANRNVFKVATARSVKLKAKAQKVMSNLKKLDLKEIKAAADRKDKTAQIDKQFQELRKEIRSKPKAKSAAAKQQKKKKNNTRQSAAPVKTDATASLVEQMQIS